MNVIVTTDDNKVIACLPIENDKEGILANGYKAFKVDEPIFTDVDGEVLYYSTDN